MRLACPSPDAAVSDRAPTQSAGTPSQVAGGPAYPPIWSAFAVGGKRGWPAERYGAFKAEAMIAALLPSNPAAARHAAKRLG
jgi:hypothetical protein